ncbi:hypothetical protein [Rhizobium sp. AAP43]|uniref:hypothetical protein n=1 Tax=Rhizobium sp. AAP43 TaxID=1523420 RepID=UPI0006B8E617|nr:hypothetical protein [Rhizobium sp. AAP43]KPF47089.1 hypothetical protein IP76_01985 [Rhizobium sp. AAP43]
MRAILVFAVSAVLAIPAQADDLRDLARALGEIMASEAACGLKLDPDAIRALVRSRVPADDLRFMKNVDNEVVLFPGRLEDMTESVKAAHCEQMGRLAVTLKIAKAG